MGENRIFKEWMLPCRTNEVRFMDEAEVVYYVSEGMFETANTVFVYTNQNMRYPWTKEPVKIYSLASNMGVVNITYLEKSLTNANIEEP